MPRKIIVLSYPITRSEFAKVYNLSEETFAAWLKDINISHSKKLSPAEINTIVGAYGIPLGYKIEV